MRRARRLGLVLFLAFTGSTPARAQTTLNLSQDLVPLGIAATNMAPNQPSLDAGPLLQSGVGYAVAHHIDRVIADSGTYYFLNLLTSNAHVQLGGNPVTPGVSNLTIDLQGSALIFTHPLQYGIILWDNTNVVLQNFTADFQPLPFTQLRVVAVNPALAQIQYSVEPGWQNPSAFNSAQPSPGTGPIVVEVHVFRNGRPAFGTRRMAAQMPFAGDHFTIVPLYGFDPTAANLAKIRPGDIAVIAMRQFGEALAVNRCHVCTLRNITVYSGASAAVDGVFLDSTVWERVYSIPKPGTDRLISTFGIGFEASGHANQIRLSRAIRTLDGGITPYVWVTGEVESQDAIRTVTVVAGGGSLNQKITNGSPVVFQRRSDGVILFSAIVVSQSVSGPIYNPDRLTFTFDRDLPNNLVGAAMYTTDANQRGGGSLIERNTVQEKALCCVAMDVWGWMGSTIRGNYIRRSAFAGIWSVQSLVTNFWTTPPLVDMTFRNNVLDRANMTQDWWLFELGGIEMATLLDGGGLIPTSPHQNITISDNFIADPGRSAVWIGNTLGGNVSGNYFLHANERPELAVPFPPKTNVFAPLIVDTTSSGITTTNNTVDQLSGVMFVTDTQYRELAAYAPGATIRLNAYNLGALANPAVTLTDADGITTALTVQNAAAQALDFQLPPAAGLGGAFVTLTSGGAKYFGTLFIDSQDNVPAVNGCTYESSLSSTLVPSTASSVPILVVTQAGCSYQVLASDPFVSPGGGSTGTALISVGLGANIGPGRRTTIEIAGQPITLAQSGIADGNTFTDANVNGIVIKAVHLAELRARINAVRTLKGLALFPWTDPVPGQGSTTIRATHLQELRAALNEAYVAAGRIVPQYTDAMAAGSTMVRAVHITELRSAILALEQP